MGILKEKPNDEERRQDEELRREAAAQRNARQAGGQAAFVFGGGRGRELTEAEIEAETQRLRADMAARLPEIEEIRRQRERVMQQRRERENQ